jgi:uncharacterized protein (TIGR02588 family)
MSQRRKRDEAQERRSPKVEAITLGISIVILLVLAGLIIYQGLVKNGGPVAIRVLPQFQEMRQEHGLYYLPVQLVNESSQTATDVLVTFTLEVNGDRPETATISIPFLAGELTVEGVVAFAQEPTAGNLRHVLSYIDP